ncbi:MAG TPA: GNAT family N-acetyltransferase [Blastocatellia bacterium]|nr:GNAT family N-acetyltransferase [Blastocatellia bacterium]
MINEWRREGYLISTDKRLMDVAVIHGYLTRSYWAAGVPLDVVERSIEHSLAFGLYEGERQVGFARVITDRATFAYLADVFILEEFRGRGLGLWLIEAVMSHPDLQGLRRWMLVTRDAHGLYRKSGFADLKNPESIMEKTDPAVYSKAPCD